MTDPQSPAEYSAEWWLNEIKLAEKELDEKWRTSADKIVLRYLDRRTDGDSVVTARNNDAKKYNVFWANTQILKSALYATPPKPVVKRAHDDANDDEARVAALILQRILSHDISMDDSDMHRAIQLAVDDRLIPGAGQVWLRLDTQTETVQVDGSSQPIETVVHQEIKTDYLHWRDFIWQPARTWDEVGWVAKRAWLTKNKFAKRFGDQALKDSLQDIAAKGEAKHGYPKGFVKGKLCVLEIWCKETDKVYWVLESTSTMLEEREPPMVLEGFFPCPKPLLATHTTNALIPRPDYVMVQDQYEELDILNDRISMLSKALRVVGMYDGSNGSISQLLSGSEMQMIPVDNWAMFAERGGVKGVVDWFPIDTVSKVLEALVMLRPTIIQQIYELTSISDIMRGGSNPRETLGAQKLKAQYSSVRLRLIQQDVAQFVCSIMKIKCQIISKHMVPEMIAKAASIEFSESAPLAQQAVAFIKRLEANEYRIEISEESLSMADYTAERELRIAYITAVGQFLSQATQMATSMPQIIPFLLRMLMWVTASFRSSDDIETVLEEAAKAPPPQLPADKGQTKPDPAIVANINARKDIQIAGMKNQNTLQVEAIRQQGKSAEQASEKAESTAKLESMVQQLMQNQLRMQAVLEKLLGTQP